MNIADTVIHVLQCYSASQFVPVIILHRCHHGMMQSSTMFLKNSIYYKVRLRISSTTFCMASTSWVPLLFLAHFQNTVETMVSSVLIARYTDITQTFPENWWNDGKSKRTELQKLCKKWLLQGAKLWLNAADMRSLQLFKY